MHSAGLELTKLAYTRLEDDLIRHRRDRCENIGRRLPCNYIVAIRVNRVMLAVCAPKLLNNAVSEGDKI